MMIGQQDNHRNKRVRNEMFLVHMKLKTNSLKCSAYIRYRCNNVRRKEDSNVKTHF